MKKVIAAIIVLAAGIIAFFSYQMNEKSTQKEIYEEATVFFEEKDYKKAIQYFEEADEHDNLFSGDLKQELLYYKAEAYMNLEEYEKAVRIYNGLIGDNPKESMNHILKGHCYYSAGEFEKAIQAYKMGYDETKEEEFLTLLCNLYVSIGEYEEALLVIADSEDVKDEEVRKGLAFLKIVIYEKKEEYAKAYESAAAYCENYPEDEKGLKEKVFLESRK